MQVVMFPYVIQADNTSLPIQYVKCVKIISGFECARNRRRNDLGQHNCLYGIIHVPTKGATAVAASFPSQRGGWYSRDASRK